MHNLFLQVKEKADSVPAQWVKANTDAPPRDFELIARKVKLPSQDNYCDCGLFLLTYVEFFTYGLPDSFQFNLSPKRAWDVEELMGACLLLTTAKRVQVTLPGLA